MQVLGSCHIDRPVKRIYRSLSPIMYNYIIAFAIQTGIASYYAVIAMVRAEGDEVLYMQYFEELIARNTLLMLAVTAIVAIPIMILLMVLDRKKIEAWDEIGQIKNKSPKQVLIVVLLASSCCIALNNMITLTRIIEWFPGYTEIAEQIYSSTIAMQFLTAGFLAPILEELVFRGLAYRRMRHYLDVKWAMILSSLLFGIYHGNMVQAIYAFLMGMMMAYVYEKYRSIAWPILFHIIANCVSVCMSSTILGEVLNANVIIFIFVTIITTALFLFSLYLVKKDVGERMN